jgi:CheY-like chemotaxis protein
MLYSHADFQALGFPQNLKTMPSESRAPVTLNGDNRVLILVVERNPAVQRLERYFLEQAGYSVEFTNDGLSALERARELKPAILVSEILVPALDGLGLCRAIKTDPKTSHILVLIFSHLHAEDRARDAGADAFLIKPLNEELLIETVEKLVSRVGREKGTK